MKLMQLAITRNLILPAVLFWGITLVVAAQVPGLLSYQGRLLTGSSVFEGTGEFKFALVNSDGSKAYWLNSPDTNGDGQPDQAVSIPIARGLYSVLLGDTNMSRMSLLPADVFTNSAVYLRVWFNNGTNGFQALKPDQRVAAAGYAMMAATVADGSITAAKLAPGAVSALNITSGTLADTRLSTNVALLSANQRFDGVNTFTDGANTFVGRFNGNGIGMTNLQASKLIGTVSDTRLPANIARLNGDATFTGTVTASRFGGDAGDLVNVQASQLTGTVADNRLSGNVALRNADQTLTGINTLSNPGNVFTGNGAGLSGLDASKVTTGTLANERLATNIARLNADQRFDGVNTFTNGANAFAGRFNGNGIGLTNLLASKLIGTVNEPQLPANIARLNDDATFTGTVRASRFGGDAADLVNVQASQLTGTVADNRLSGNVALRNADQALTGINTLNNPGNVFTGNGVGLSGLDASKVTTGTLADGQLSTNIARLNTDQSFNGVNTFTNGANAFVGRFNGNGIGLTNLQATKLLGTVNDAQLPASIARLNGDATFTGTVRANRFGGDAGDLVNVQASQLTGTVADNSLSANVALRNANQTLTGINTLNNPGNVFTGNGAGLSGLDASKVTTGTLADGQLSTNIARLNADQIFDGVNLFTNGGNIFVGRFNGNGIGLTNLQATKLLGTVNEAQLPASIARLNGDATFTGTVRASRFGGDAGDLVNVQASQLTGTVADNSLSANVALRNANQTLTGINTLNNPGNVFTGNGAGLSSLDASKVTTGTLADGHLSTNIARLNADQSFQGVNSFTNVGNTFVGLFNGNGAGLTNLPAPTLTGTVNDAQLPANIARLNGDAIFAGTVRASRFGGDAIDLVNIQASQLTGTVADNRLSANVALRNADQTLTGVNTLNNPGNVFMGNGAGLSGLDASKVTTGTLADGHLSANVARLNADQNFQGVNTITNVGNTFGGLFNGNGAGLTNLQAPKLTGTVNDAQLPANIARLNGDATFTGTVRASRFGGDAVELVNVQASQLTGIVADNSLSANVALRNADQTLTGVNTLNNPGNVFMGNGAGLSGLDASKVTTGTLADGHLSANVARLNADQNFQGVNTITNVGNTFGGLFNGNGAGLTNLQAPKLTGTVNDAQLPANIARLNGDATFTGTVRASRFGGDAVELVNVQASQLTGIVADNSLSANVALRNADQTLTGINTLNNPGNVFTGNGAGLSGLDASKISSGILNPNRIPALDASWISTGRLPPERLPSNVAYKDTDLLSTSNALAVQWAATSAAFSNQLATINTQIQSLSNQVISLSNTLRVIPPITVSSAPQDTNLIAAGYTLFMTAASSQWTNGTTTNALLARNAHSSVWTGQEMIIWGGLIGAGISSGAGSIYNPQLDQWRLVSPVDSPSARNGHTAVWTGQQMIIWGGSSSGIYLTDGGRFQSSPQQWYSMASAGAPAGRHDHAAVWTGSRMVVWGGRNGGGLLDDGALYDPSTDQWNALNLSGQPSARYGASAVWAGDRFMVWGGEGTGGVLDSGGELLCDGSGIPTGWQTLSVVNAPSARSGHSAVWTGQRMIVWGGQASGSFYGNGAVYDPTANTWQPISTTGAPSPRSGHNALWTGQEMVVWGGEDGTGALASGAAYDPVNDRWRDLSSAGNPQPRSGGVAAWTGIEVIVFGGRANGQVVGMLQRLNPQPTWYLYRKL